ncbi:hypothetical protein SLEP1_g34881 [Rubroshorea leprosula]|uniref:Secreted protein n=1 Tax=Rubroshorea leprosula TaxID=152421 RepID=A0AAV5KLG6_9ROSI|nr:hypothetical protein SLEP1_g34881 [Rubroshorea leprosula]
MLFWGLIPAPALLLSSRCSHPKKKKKETQPAFEKPEASGSALLCSSPPAAPALWGRISLILDCVILPCTCRRLLSQLQLGFAC